MNRSEPGADCLRLAEAFSDLVDGDAPADLAAEAMGHVEHCGYCQGEFSRFEEVVRQCREAGEPVPGRRCRERLMKLFKDFHARGESV